MLIVSDRDAILKAKKVLIHEHVFCRFRNESIETASAYLIDQFKGLADLGVDLIADTTTYVTPDALSSVETDSRVNVACCAGYYTERFIQRHHRSQSIEELTKSLERKVMRGLGNTRIRPLMLKCGSGGSKPSSIEAKAIAAVARVKSQTGLPLQVHSCDGAEEQCAILTQHTSATNLMFCHVEMGMKTGRRLNRNQILDRCYRLLDRGYFLYFNDFGISRSEYQRDVLLIVRTLVEKNYENQICIGTDSSWTVRRGNVFARGVLSTSNSARTYRYIFDHTIPSLRDCGLGEAVIQKICFETGRSFLLSHFPTNS